MPNAFLSLDLVVFICCRTSVTVHPECRVRIKRLQYLLSHFESNTVQKHANASDNITLDRASFSRILAMQAQFCLGLCCKTDQPSHFSKPPSLVRTCLMIGLVRLNTPDAMNPGETKLLKQLFADEIYFTSAVLGHLTRQPGG